jgi:hypothetical protein
MPNSEGRRGRVSREERERMNLLKLLRNQDLPKFSSDSCHRFVERVFIQRNRNLVFTTDLSDGSEQEREKGGVRGEIRGRRKGGGRG